MKLCRHLPFYVYQISNILLTVCNVNGQLTHSHRPMSTEAIIKEEQIKLSDPTLGGTIGETMALPEADRFSADDEKFIKIGRAHV